MLLIHIKQKYILSSFFKHQNEISVRNTSKFYLIALYPLARESILRSYLTAPTN